MATKTKPKDALEELFAKASKNGLRVGSMADTASDTLWLTTGNLAMDAAFGGGIPMGRHTELYGRESSGKTTCALQTAIHLQRVIKAGGDPARGIKADDVILYLDYENAMDPAYAEALGLDVNHPSFRITQPDTMEEGLDLVIAGVKTDRIRLVLVDAVASMVPSAQAEQESVGKATVALAARILKVAGQNLNPILRQHNAAIIWINHEMEVMNMGGPPSWGPPQTTTPGGRSLKFFASLRVQFRVIRAHKGPWTDPLTGEVKEIPLAQDVRVKVMKNKVAAPFKEALVRVRFGRGFDQFWTAMQILVANQKVVYASSNKRYYFDAVSENDGAPDWMARDKDGAKRPFIYGEKAVFRAADKHPEWRDALIVVAMDVAEHNLDAMKNVVPTGEKEEDDLEEEQQLPEDIDDLLDSNSKNKRMNF